uniref:uncharacterized protein LOC120335055 n=1 Tax=Styela clava TaxID=7725 RepID=UPI001939B1A9|nr:uncharacterized protein LOC120335055 [Styela clava]
MALLLHWIILISFFLLASGNHEDTFVKVVVHVGLGCGDKDGNMEIVLGKSDDFQKITSEADLRQLLHDKFHEAIQNSPCPLASLNDATIEIKTDIEKVQPTPVRTTSTSTLKQVLTTTAEQEPQTIATTTVQPCTEPTEIFSSKCVDDQGSPVTVCQTNKNDTENNTPYFAISLAAGSNLKLITNITSTPEGKCTDFSFLFMKVANGTKKWFNQANYGGDTISFATPKSVDAIRIEHENIENCTITVFGC